MLTCMLNLTHNERANKNWYTISVELIDCWPTALCQISFPLQHTHNAPILASLSSGSIFERLWWSIIPRSDGARNMLDAEAPGRQFGLWEYSVREKKATICNIIYWQRYQRTSQGWYLSPFPYILTSIWNETKIVPTPSLHAPKPPPLSPRMHQNTLPFPHMHQNHPCVCQNSIHPVPSKSQLTG